MVETKQEGQQYYLLCHDSQFKEGGKQVPLSKHNIPQEFIGIHAY